jgi:hypothetical protein
MPDITRRSWVAQCGLLSAAVPRFAPSDTIREHVMARDKAIKSGRGGGTSRRSGV